MAIFSKKTKVKKSFFYVFSLLFFVFCFFISSNNYAQELQIIQKTGSIIECDQNKLNFEGPYDIKQGVSSYFFVSNKGKHTPVKTIFSVFFQGKPIHTETSLSGEMRYAFDKIGTYELKTKIYNGGCFYEKNKIIRVYKDIVLYIGNFLQDFNFGLLDNIQQNDFLLSTIILDKSKLNNTNIEENVIKKKSYIKQSKYIFLNNTSLSSTFDIIENLKNKIKDFDEKNVFIISNNDEELTRKFIASKIHKQHLNNIYTISYKNFWDVVVSMSIDNPNFKFLKQQKPVIIEVKEQKRSFGGLIDMLIFYGINIQFIELIFIAIIAILFIVFLKQIVGLPGYGLYFPIIASLTLFNIPLHFFVILLCFAYIAHYLSRYITDKITLLVYAKLGLYVSIYAIISLLGFIIYFLLPVDIIENIIFSPNVLISWVLIGMIAKKILSDIKNIKNGLIQSGWFILLVRSIFQLFHISWLQHFVLLNPSIIFICIILIILMGRFTGLMITEYIRFWPFIKKRLLRKKKKK